MPKVTTAAKDREMGIVTSADGTPIAFERTGSGEFGRNSMLSIATGEEVSDS